MGPLANSTGRRPARHTMAAPDAGATDYIDFASKLIEVVRECMQQERAHSGGPSDARLVVAETQLAEVDEALTVMACAPAARNARTYAACNVQLIQALAGLWGETAAHRGRPRVLTGLWEEAVARLARPM